MIHTSKKLFLTVVLISIWTLVQATCHLIWVLYGYLMLMCKIRPEYFDVVFVYLTYLYKDSCGPIDLKKGTLFLSNSMPEDFLYGTNETSSKLLYRFLVEILDKGELPLQSKTFNRTELYLTLLCISDIGWFLSAIGLTVGAFFKSKQKYLSIAFYGPWLLCSLFVNFLDVVSAVHFGIDLISINSYTTWLQFVGVRNYYDFSIYDQHPSAKVVPAIPSTLMVSLLSRFFFIWLLNVVCFFVILFWAIPDLFLKTTVHHRTNKDKSDREIDFNTSEARIRNWQTFYGTCNSTSSMDDNAMDLNANDSSTKHHVTFIIGKKQSAPLEKSGNFRRYSDVAENVETLPQIHNAINNYASKEKQAKIESKSGL